MKQREERERQRREEEEEGEERSMREEQIAGSAEGKLGKEEVRNDSNLALERKEVGIRIEELARGSTSAFLACKLAQDNTWASLASAVERFDRSEQAVEVRRLENFDLGFGSDLARERLEAELRGKLELQVILLLLEYRGRRYIARRTCRCREGRSDKGCFELHLEAEG